MATIIKTTLPVVDAIIDTIKARGVSQRQAAIQLGVSPSTIGNWAEGSNVPDVRNEQLRTRIGSFLQVPPIRVLELFGLDVSDELPSPPLEEGGGAAKGLLACGTTTVLLPKVRVVCPIGHWEGHDDSGHRRIRTVGSRPARLAPRHTTCLRRPVQARRCVAS